MLEFVRWGDPASEMRCSLAGGIKLRGGHDAEDGTLTSWAAQAYSYTTEPVLVWSHARLVRAVTAPAACALRGGGGRQSQSSSCARILSVARKAASISTSPRIIRRMSCWLESLFC